MTANWTALDRELVAWARAGLTLPLWWRDDDAIEPTLALGQLADLAQRVGLPVHLAVIPTFAQNTLRDVVDGKNLIPVVHGWSHQNHAADGEKKAEYPTLRPLAHMTSEAANSLLHLSNLFGDTLCPMFVPPWNRVSPGLIAELPKLGYTILSTFTPRTQPDAAAGLRQINTHLDPIAWHAGKSLIDPDALIAQVAQHLADRRTGLCDADEPYGILTHHLVHDPAIWAFIEQLILRLMQGPAYAWTSQQQGLLP